MSRRGRSQSPHSTAAAMSRGKCGKQSRTEGRWVGRWMRNGPERITESIGSARKGYTRCRSSRLVVGGRYGLDRAHGVGAGQRRQRRYGQSIKRFEARAELYLTELSTALRDGSYQPQPIRRVEIPKGDGRLRPLGIPTVKDRIVQTAVKSHSSRSLRRGSDRRATAFGRDGAAWVRYAKWLS